MSERLRWSLEDRILTSATAVERLKARARERAVLSPEQREHEDELAGEVESWNRQLEREAP